MGKYNNCRTKAIKALLQNVYIGVYIMPIVGVIRQSLYYIPYYDAENEIIVKKYVPKPKRDTYIKCVFHLYIFRFLIFWS